MIHSYPSIYALGHAAIATLLHGDVLIEEKVDGSQISFGLINGELVIRSKGAVVNHIVPEGMFKKAVEVISLLLAKEFLVPGYIYRGEYLSKPKHNVAAYNRVPTNHIMIFDIEVGEQTFLNPTLKALEAAKLGMEVVPEIARWFYKEEGRSMSIENLRSYLERKSVLGGQKIEGVVIKPLHYDLFGRDKKVLMGKFVSEAFKEVHAAEWKTEHGPKSGRDIIGEIAATYGTPARWQKAAIHLQEKSDIEFSPRDIGKLMAEVPLDIDKEEREAIKELLWKWAWPNIRRSVTRGLPQWWKDSLLKRQFDQSDAAHTLAEDAELEKQFQSEAAMLPVEVRLEDSALESGRKIDAPDTSPELHEAEHNPFAQHAQPGDPITPQPSDPPPRLTIAEQIDRMENEGAPVPHSLQAAKKSIGTDQCACIFLPNAPYPACPHDPRGPLGEAGVPGQDWNDGKGGPRGTAGPDFDKIADEVAGEWGSV